jgi:ComF family protein
VRSPQDRPSSPHRARAALEALAGLVYPSLCLGCERRLPAPDTLPVCATCLAALPRAPEGVAAAALRECGAPPGVEGGTVLWQFDSGSTVRRIQHALKYGGHPSMGRPLGALLGRARDADAPVADLVVPVPLSRVRQLERGYNQSATLAEGMADALGAPLELDLLVRTRATRKQTRLSAAERQANVRGAFEVRTPEAVRGRHVVLVDDVLTTGATLAEAAAALASCGATVEVAALCVAGR